MSLEIEIKLTMRDPDPIYISLLLGHPLLSPGSLSEELTTHYFDTPDLDLWKQGFSLRIRENESHKVQTLKKAGQPRGDLEYREEWEQSIKESKPNIGVFKDKEVTKKLEAIIGKQSLIKIFDTQFLRTRWHLDQENGTEIDVVLDQGTINMGSKHMLLEEIELELKKGDADQLEELANVLKKTLPLIIEKRSKAERGYKLYIEHHKAK